MQQYTRSSVESILRDYLGEAVEIREDGVWVSKAFLEHDYLQVVSWNPACELEGPDAPDPLEAPGLPIPFTAAELAAFMLAGVGSLLLTSYGCWEDGPDERMLDGLGVTARKPREALRAAYAAYRDAERAVGGLDAELQRRANDLEGEFDEKNNEANARECVFEVGISDAERNVRRERAKASVADLEEWSRAVGKQAEAELSNWLKAMVNFLLQPTVTAVAKTVRVPAYAAHEANLLNALRDLKFDPKALPQPPPGLASAAKEAARRALCDTHVMTVSQLNHAWKRLRKQAEIANSKP